MIATLTKTFTFDAAHRLNKLPEDHKCHRLHGHTYECTLVITGLVQEDGPFSGFVIDYADIAEAWKSVHDDVDHRYLNELMRDIPPTTENLAALIAVGLSLHPKLFGPDVTSRLTTSNQAVKTTLLERVVLKESSTTSCVMEIDRLHRFNGLARGSWIDLVLEGRPW